MKSNSPIAFVGLADSKYSAMEHGDQLGGCKLQVWMEVVLLPVAKAVVSRTEDYQRWDRYGSSQVNLDE